MGKEETTKLRTLRVKATTPDARLIQNPETRFPREKAIAIDEAQTAMNDLYRKDAEYGDGSSAFMVMKEARQRIDREIKKMTEALQWAEEYRSGNAPEIPGWAKPWKAQLGQ